jgi:hypothetical protein
MRGGNAVRDGGGAVAGDGLEEIMAELSERKEVNGGRAILGWDVAVDRAAWLRFRYAFWGGFAAWALLHLSPLDGSRHMPATFGDAMWLVITAVLAGLARLACWAGGGGAKGHARGCATTGWRHSASRRRLRRLSLRQHLPPGQQRPAGVCAVKRWRDCGAWQPILPL